LLLLPQSGGACRHKFTLECFIIDVKKTPEASKHIPDLF